jgi:peptidoglycan/xylan/chitin deacetylase (PgdA/CDA1 family)
MSEKVFNSHFQNNKLRKAAAILTAAVALSACAREVEAMPVQPEPVTTTQTVTETVVVTPETTPPPPITTIETPAPPPPSAIDCMVERCIALTFDDGPGPYTEQLLRTLADHNTHATFFMVGTQVQSYPDVVRDIAAQGHQLGNHSWNHDQLTALGAQAAADNITRTNNLITETTGVAPRVMRPPYGETNQSTINAVGMPEIIWSVDPEDWKYRDSDYVADHVIRHADRGDIVLMHDIHQTTVNAVPRILDSLQSQGYTLVTIDTLLGSNLPVGKYSSQG